ncbi:MAG: GNAT family N-acetyltransferase [Woeseiaceae bacterium]
MSVRSDALILGFDKARHMEGLRQCLIELQDFERRLEPRMPEGIDIAEPYLAEMFKRCQHGGGRVLIAEVDGVVAGYATIFPKVQSEDLEDGDFEYALLSDLVVLERFRGQGLGRKLLQAAELYARTCKARYLRIGVLAGNGIAENLYANAGFSPRYVELEKVLTRS